MVKLREEFHSEQDHTIEANVWFQHVGENRNPQEINFLQQAYQLSLLSGEHVPTITGNSCIQEGLAIADILDNLGLDIDTIVAGMVYPSVRYAELSAEDITEHLGEKIAKLVSGAIKMDAIQVLYNDSQHHHGQNVSQIDNIRKMLLAMVEDVRVVLLKLAERTVLMRSIGVIGATKQQQIAKETQDIYAPLANRLGIAQIKWELEDFAFRYLHADTYKSIAKSVAQKRTDRERYIKFIINNIENLMTQSGITKFEVTGRAKHIYSIYRKMQRKNVDFSQIYDASAVRILVPKLEDCYTALGIVHDQWEPITEEFDDYISNPKPNGYRSLHTAVIGPKKHNIEIQIRTWKMHQEAELGVAAHWIYKEGGSKRSSYDQKIDWLRQLIDWQKEITHSQDQLETNSQQVFEDRIYVFTPTGEIMDLPQGATPLDFAYAVHTEVGHRCRGAKINKKIVPLTYHLKMGEQVEILTGKEAHPSRDWLNPNLGYLKSSRAKAKVHHWFKKQDHDKNLQLGREMLERELKRLHIGQDHKSKYDHNKLLERFNYKSDADLLAALGAGGLKLGQIIGAIENQLKEQVKENLEAKDEIVIPLQPIRRPTTHPEAINIQGIGNLLYHIANCCKPVPGDGIVGFITQGRGVSIHRKDCANILAASTTQQERLLEVNWGETAGTYPVDLVITAYDRHGLVRDITSILSNEKINLIALNTNINKSDHIANLTLTLEIPDLSELWRILDRIQQLTNVVKVERKA